MRASEVEQTQDAAPLTLARLARVTLGFAGLVIVCTWPQILRLGDGVADHFDPLFSIWRLKRLARQIFHDPSHLFDGNIFYPALGTLANSDATFLEGALAAPFLEAGVPAVAVYNILLLSGMVASAVGMYVFARRLTRSNGAAVVAGIVFALAPYRFEHFMHLELQWAQWMPLTLWALHRTLESGRVKDGLLTGFFLLLQFLSSVYYGLFLVTFLLVVGLPLLFFCRRAPLSRVIGALLAGALLSAIVVLPYSRPYRANAERLGERTQEEIERWSAHPESYLATPSGNVVYGRLSGPLGGSEARLFPGLTTIVLGVLALLWGPRRVRFIYLAGLLLALDFSLGVNGLVYPWLLEPGSPFRGLRAPARFGILVNLALALFAAWGVTRLRSSARSEAVRRWIPALCGALLVVEYWSAPLPLRHVPNRPLLVYEWLGRQPPSVVVELPMWLSGADPQHDAEYEYYSTFHWQRLVNGYSGYYPRAYLDLMEQMRGFPSGASLEALHALGVDFIVVHLDKYDPDDLEVLLEEMDERPEFFTAVATFPDYEGTARVYRLTWPTPAGSTVTR
ncbi:MAG: hypothetical protein GEV06_20900 [Luteitalea sp.]|nr:hypothetical protein [Luteitalea sp.]